MPRRAATAATTTVRCAARLILILLALAWSAAAPAQTRIGYIDMKRLLDNAPQMASGNERLRAEFAARDRALKADEARLTSLQDRQRREAGLTTAEAADALAAEIEALERKVRRTRDSLRDELRRRSEEETELRWREINETVAAFARDQNYDLIVSSPVFYASPAIDVTDQVLSRLRQQNQDQRPPDGD